MTQEPYPVKKKNPWIWVSLGCFGIVAILGIFAIVMTTRFLGSPEGKQFTSAMERTQSLETPVKETAAGLQKYVTEKGDFPATLDDLKGYVGDSSLAKVKEEMKYTKPAKDAPGDTVVLTTGYYEFMRGAKQKIEILKNFEHFSDTRAPLE